MKKLVFKIFNKVYRVQFITHGKQVQVRYVSLRRWEQFDENELVSLLAKELKLKTNQLQVKAIERM